MAPPIKASGLHLCGSQHDSTWSGMLKLFEPALALSPVSLDAVVPQNL